VDSLLLNIGGLNYSGWKNISVRGSMEGLAHGFQISLADIGETDISAIEPGAPLTLIIDKDGRQVPIFSGYVDDRDRTRSGTVTGLTVSGRSKTADLVDCSAIFGNNTFTKIDFTQLAIQLCKPFGIKVVSNLDQGETLRVRREANSQQDATSLTNYTIKTGASVFEVLEETGRKVGAVLTTDWEGNLVLSYADVALRSDADLIDGQNVKKLTEKWSVKRRHHEYIFKGQTTGGGGKPWLSDETISIKRTSKDPEVTRYRPKIVQPSGKMNSKTLQKTANWEAQVRAGRSKYYLAELNSWFQGPKGQPWQINSVANLFSEEFNVNTLLLITEVEFTKDDSGTIASLTLKDRRTYQSNPAGGF